MAILGIFASFIVWFIATLPLAFEVLVLLLPWSLGWTDEVNVTLARTLFWFFGHPLVYFWLLPAYTMYYAMLPKIAGGKLYSDFAGRLAFMLFILLSCPIGLHHQYSDPGIQSSWKWFHGILTFCVALPSFITAFTLAASMEIGARSRGGKGLFAWWAKLPHWNSKGDQWLFPYLFLGLILFLFGGITGIINASAAMNGLIHNTSWVPAHFHTTLGGPVFLAFIAMSLWMVVKILGKPVRYPRLNLSVPYLWILGVVFFSTGMSVTGLMGEPRRTNMGMTFTNPESPLFHEGWKFISHFVVIGGTIMFLSMIAYFIVFFGTLFSSKTEDDRLDFPNAEPFHDENISWVQNFKPWLVATALVLAVAYTIPLLEVYKGTKKGAPAYSPDNPIPLRDQK